MFPLIRAFLSTWAARAFFLVLIGSFVLWGAAGAINNAGSSSAVAVVGRQTVEPQQLQDAFRNNVAQAESRNGNQPLSPENRQQVARITLEQLVQDALVAEQARKLGVGAPDAAVRAAIFAMPQFQQQGRFDRAVFDQVLQANRISEPRVLDFMRAGLLHDQLLTPLRDGMAAPDALVDRVFEIQGETRVADLVEIPFAAAAPPPEPTVDDLRRIYDNNPSAYSAPEYRRIRAVILSPDTIGRGIEVSDAEIEAAYEADKSAYVQPELRAAEIIIAPDRAKADALAAAWRAGADWEAMQREAAAAGAAAVALQDGAPANYPTAELGQAVFAAAPGEVDGPSASPGGFQIVRVSHVAPAKDQPLAEVRDEVREQIVRPRALAELPEAQRRLQDEIASVDTLDKLPGGLGVLPIVGTLDAQGNTPDGTPAPLPSQPAVRQAILTAAFQAQPGALPVLIQGPDETWFAVTLEDTSAAVLKPFDQVQDQLRADYDLAARRRTQEEAATKLLTAAKTARNLDDAATVADLRVTRTPELRRSAPTEGVPIEAARAIFDLPKGDATMVQAGEAFYVVSPVEIRPPAQGSDQAILGLIRKQMTLSMQKDVELTYVNALRTRAQPRVNQQLFDQATQ